MKKLLSTLLVTVLTFSTFAFAASAMALNSDSVTLFESMENLQNMDSFSITQNFSGNFKIEDTYANSTDKAKGQFNFRTTSDTYKENDLESNLHIKINGRIGVQIEGDDKPFDNLTANVRAEIMIILDDGIYVRLNQALFRANGVPKDEMAEYLESKEIFEEAVGQIKGQWIYFPEELLGLEEEFGSELPPELEELFDNEALLQQIEEEGLKATIKEIIKAAILADGGLSDEEADQANNIIDRFFETKFFTNKKMTRGRYKDFTRFTLSKRRILSFIQSAANEMDEPISNNDLKEIQNALSKFYLSGMYHINNHHRIFDQFKIKFILHDLEELKNFRIGYFYKVGDFNKVERIVAPDEFTSYENVDMSFLDEL